MPATSLAMRVALSLDPGEAAFDAADPSRLWAQSRVDVSVGLDFRPLDGLVLDVDYAKLMNIADTSRSPGTVVLPHAVRPGRYRTADELIRVSLNIRF